MEERKITLVDDDQTLEFYVVEETKLNGANYLLVTDAEDDDEEGDCYILKDMSGADESDALYEFVEDEDELEGLMKIFAWISRNSRARTKSRKQTFNTQIQTNNRIDSQETCPSG